MSVRAALAALALILALVCPALAQEADHWQLMLERNYEDLKHQKDYVDALAQGLPATMGQTSQDLAGLRQKYEELMVFHQAGGRNPLELRAVLAGLDILEGQAKAVSDHLNKNQSTLGRLQDRLGELDKELSLQKAQSPTPDMAQALEGYLKQLRQLKSGLAALKSSLDQGLSPIRDLEQSLEKSRLEVDARLQTAWRDYFLHSGRGLISPQAWVDAWSRLSRLKTQAYTYSALMRSGQVRPLEALARLLVLWGLLTGGCWLGLGRVYAKIPWPGSRTRPLGGLIWMGLGVSLIWAASGQGFLLVNAELGSLAQIFISFGAVELSWFLRRLEKGDQPPGANPTVPAWRLFALGVALQAPWLPEVTRAALWLVSLGLGWYWRQGQAQGPDVVARCARARVWLYPSLGVLTVLGWVNLSVLLAMAWFLGLLCLQIGLALYGLATAWLGPMGRVDLDRPRRSLGAYLVLPLSLTFMLGLFLFWLSLSMGGASVFLILVDHEVAWGGVSLDLTRAALMLTGFYLARAGKGFMEALLARLPQIHPGLERGVVNLLETCSTYLIWGLFALGCLSLIGASLTSLAVVAGGLSVGIGFGLQQIINNFISGLILLFGRSIQAGDTLQIGETWGVVQRVNIRNTVVRTFDNAALLVPNSELITQKIINWSHRDRKVRRSVDVPVAYGADPDLVRALLLEACSAHPHVLKEPKPSVILADIRDTGVLAFRLLIWIDDVDHALKTGSEVRLRVEKALRENHLRIAAIVQA